MSAGRPVSIRSIRALRKEVIVMGRAKETYQKMHQILDAWKKIAPEESFAGLTLDEFTAALQPSFDARSETAEAVLVRRAAIASREEADKSARDLMKRVVGSVVGSPVHGSNSALYRAMGYRTEGERASGLTRKSQTAENQLTELTQVEEAEDTV